MAGVGPAWLRDVGFGLRSGTLPVMTAWIVLSALTALSALALRHARPKDPPLPRGYDGERQLAELRARVVGGTYTGLSDGPPTPSIRRLPTLQGRPWANHGSTAWIGRLGSLYADLRRAWRDGAALPPELPLRDYPIARR